jgi:hypothetical protein
MVVGDAVEEDAAKTEDLVSRYEHQNHRCRSFHLHRNNDSDRQVVA